MRGEGAKARWGGREAVCRGLLQVRHYFVATSLHLLSPPSLSPSPTPSHTNTHIITNMQTISHFLRHIRNLHFVHTLVQESNICNPSDSSVTNLASYSLLISDALRSLLSHIPFFSLKLPWRHVLSSSPYISTLLSVACFFSKMRPPTWADKLHWFMASLTLSPRVFWKCAASVLKSCLSDYLIWSSFYWCFLFINLHIILFFLWKALLAHLCYLCPFCLLHSRWESFHIKESGTEDGCCSKPTWEKDFWSGAYI